MITGTLELKIYKYLEEMKGKKKLKEKDIINKIIEDTGKEGNEIKKTLREMVNVGMVMYSYGGGASSVEIPSEDYLAEKGIERKIPESYDKDISYKDIIIE